jgi:hypothetical protein
MAYVGEHAGDSEWLIYILQSCLQTRERRGALDRTIDLATSLVRSLNESDHGRLQAAIAAFATRNSWHRLWIVQEIATASLGDDRPYICCRSSKVQWDATELCLAVQKQIRGPASTFTTGRLRPVSHVPMSRPKGPDLCTSEHGEASPQRPGIRRSASRLDFDAARARPTVCSFVHQCSRIPTGNAHNRHEREQQ